MHNDWTDAAQSKYSFGVRYFPLNYFQVTLAYMSDTGTMDSDAGLYLNMSFSTKTMQSIPRNTTFGSRPRGLFGYPPFSWISKMTSGQRKANLTGKKRPKFDEHGYPYPPLLVSFDEVLSNSSNHSDNGDYGKLPTPPSLEDLDAAANEGND